ncbi:Dyp-type peroxidase [Conexibacter woesei]|uniref:Dyp-type peroxidase n=1 Tax=Conexibacter woesei TaxID=191495 RepID=UPI00040445E2|nr:Dyp-type peroxidase [Conexibacter woesei]
MSLDRRTFLRRSAALGAASLAGAGAATEATADDAPTDTTNNPLDAPVAFDGAHQAGILTAPGAQATLVALDAIANDREALLTGLATLSSQARHLAKGYSFAVREPSEPPPDSGMLGTTIAPDRLTTTIAFGASLFDDRYGLASRQPDGLTRMPRFADDAIDPDRAHGDVLLTIEAQQRDTVVHAVRELLRPLRGRFVVRWTIDGFTAADRGPTPQSARRNLFGFRDGTANPAGGDREQLLWDASGGTFQVARTIRMHTEFWDRVGLLEQENMIGRTRDSGAPIGGDQERQDPRYDLDPRGARIPLDAHIRLANPRTPQTEAQRILRKSFNYHRGIDAAGQLDQGLLFLAYNRSIQQQFEVIQRRLAGEPMTDYVTPVGGGYFYAPRGTRGATDWVGAALLT